VLRGPGRELLGLAIPALGALVAEPVFLMPNSAIVGHLGTAPFAGLGIASAVLLNAVFLCIFLAHGTTAAVARRAGAGDLRRAFTLAMPPEGVHHCRPGAGDTRYLAWTLLVALLTFLPLASTVLATDAGVVALWWALTGWLLARQVAVALRHRSGTWLGPGLRTSPHDAPAPAPVRQRTGAEPWRARRQQTVTASTAVFQMPRASSTCSSSTTSGGIIRTTLPKGPQVSSRRPSSAAFCCARDAAPGSG